MSDEQTREPLRREINVLCFGMGAVDVMDEFSSLVSRGIYNSMQRWRRQCIRRISCRVLTASLANQASGIQASIPILSRSFPKLPRHSFTLTWEDPVATSFSLLASPLSSCLIVASIYSLNSIGFGAFPPIIALRRSRKSASNVVSTYGGAISITLTYENNAVSIKWRYSWTADHLLAPR